MVHRILSSEHSASSRRRCFPTMVSGSESYAVTPRYSASLSNAMRTSVRSVAGWPLFGSIWMKSPAGQRRDQMASSSRPSISIDSPSARRRGRHRCGGRHFRALPAAHRLPKAAFSGASAGAAGTLRLG